MNAIVRARLGLKDKVWVKAKEVLALTGWNKYDLQRARTYKYIAVEKRPNNVTGRVSFFYDINSLDPRLIKAPAASLTTDIKPSPNIEGNPPSTITPQIKYNSTIQRVDNIWAAIAMLQQEVTKLRKELAPSLQEPTGPRPLCRANS